MERFRTSLLLILAAGLAACTNATVSRSFQMDPQGTDGIVIVGSESDANVSLYFSAFDETSDRVVSSSFYASHSFSHQAQKGPLQYHVMKLPAGTYVLRSLRKKRFLEPEAVICLSGGTIKFRVEPGRVVYVGNISISNPRFPAFTKIGYGGSDLDAARSHLDHWPHLKGEVIEVPAEPARFERGDHPRSCGEAR